jgi:hypothetical protein
LKAGANTGRHRNSDRQLAPVLHPGAVPDYRRLAREGKASVN